MKETPLSNCEKRFLLRAIEEKKRLDGRQCYDYRNIRISFGSDFGCCIVELGKTRVLGQVSCELVSPKPNRATEGILFFNLELSPMASPAFEPGRHSELLVKLNRLLERCLRNSKCIDTESLCVVAGEKVWQIRVDLHLLNHNGNIIDAASIAAIAALCHFRRPDVSVQGEEVTLYTPEERDPVPLSIHHMPICVSFAFFQQGTYLLVDPSEQEERVMDGLLVIAMNKHREICTIQSSGGIMLLKDQTTGHRAVWFAWFILSLVLKKPLTSEFRDVCVLTFFPQVLRCSKITGVKVAEITELIEKALENDQKIRKEGGKFGFAESLPSHRITAFKIEQAPINTNDVQEQAEEIISKASPPSERLINAVLRSPGTAQIGEGIENSWGDLEESEREEDEDEAAADYCSTLDDQNMEIGEANLETRNKTGETIVLSDSEEEDVIILEPEGIQKNRTESSSKQEHRTKKPVGKKKKKSLSVKK